MKVAADSSPLIALAKINEFQLVQQLFEEIWISSEVFSEIAVVGRGRAGSQETRSADIRQSFARLLTRGFYLERAFLDSRLKMLGLPAL